MEASKSDLKVGGGRWKVGGGRVRWVVVGGRLVEIGGGGWGWVNGLVYPILNINLRNENLKIVFADSAKLGMFR